MSRIHIALPATVQEIPVAPHRYKWNGMLPYSNRDDTPGVLGLRIHDWLKLVEYQPGEVVYVVYGDNYTRAYISLVSLAYDRYGDRRPMFRVHRETKRGTWSKLFYYAYPGQIQRGYLRATLNGMPELAPDLIGKV